jgi:hypothetical protein
LLPHRTTPLCLILLGIQQSLVDFPLAAKIPALLPQPAPAHLLNLVLQLHKLKADTDLRAIGGTTWVPAEQ